MESQNEIQCLTEMNAGNYNESEKLELIFVMLTIAESQLLGLYWTSGTNEGYGCDLKHGWCGSNTLLTEEAPWHAGEPNDLLSERCILLRFPTVGKLDLHDYACSSSSNFICEVMFIDINYRDKKLRLIPKLKFSGSSA